MCHPIAGWHFSLELLFNKNAIIPFYLTTMFKHNMSIYCISRFDIFETLWTDIKSKQSP